MTDDLERDLRGLDGERALPSALHGRLESALLDDAEARRTGSDDIAAALGSLDAPRPVPASTRAALESALLRTRWGDLRSRVLLGAAAAVIVVVGAVAALGTGSSSSSHHQVAVGTAPTTPSPSAFAQEHAPPSTGVAVPSAQGQVTRPHTSSVANRSTTATTWDCGRCARNGYTGSATPPTSPPTAATFQPTNGTSVAAAGLAAQMGIGKVDPSSGPHQGGTVVTLTGSGFTGANGVRFGAASAVNFTVVSDGEIRVETPPSPTPQRVTVTVTYPDGSSTPTSDDGPFFTYT